MAEGLLKRQQQQGPRSSCLSTKHISGVFSQSSLSPHHWSRGSAEVPQSLRDKCLQLTVTSEISESHGEARGSETVVGRGRTLHSSAAGSCAGSTQLSEEKGPQCSASLDDEG